MNRGLVFTEFTIAPADRAQFAGWHSNEHARERLEVPGVIAVERYVDVADPHHFCCLYRATDRAVFTSPGYTSLPERASPLTREITKGVKGTRFLGETFGTTGGGQGGLMMRFRSVVWTTDDASRCLATAAQEVELGTISQAEVARPGPGGPNVDDSEWIIILGGSTVEGLAEAASRVQGQAKGSGLFRLEHATWSIS